MALKIKTTKINGEDRIDPDVMDLLLRFGSHRELCDECGELCRTGKGRYCATGNSLLRELMESPTVEFVPE